MAEHGCTAISLSQMSHTSDDDSSDQNTPNIGGSGGAIAGSSSHRRPPPSAGHPHLQVLAPPPPKKPRGRPPGSKNKPKPPLVITQDNDQSLKPVVVEVAAGSDVVEALVNFARRRHVGISVLSGSGSVANVTLRHPLSHAPAFTLHGPFTLLSLTGTYISGPFPFPPSPSPPLPLVAASSSSSSTNPNPTSAASWPACSSFGISLSGSQGQIFGGVVAGKVVAASGVVVVATVFKKPEFHKVGFNGGGDGGEGDNPNVSGDQVGGKDTMSGFNVASPTPLNSQVPGDVNVMQWGHSHSSSRPANY